MTAKFHFICGLPRAGSTLLGALLRQNPRFHAGMTSPVCGLVGASVDLMSAGREAAHLVTTEQKRAIVRGLFDSYYAAMADDRVIFDTNRRWSAQLPLLADLFPDCRVIACVRDVPWVMDSIERLVRQNPYENTRLFGAGDRGTVYSRTEALARSNGLVGSAWTALKDGFYGEQSARLLVVEYDLLARKPLDVLKLIYDFVGEPWWDGHDPENVAYDAPEFDQALGVDGLHRVRPQVRFEPRRTILPPDVFARYQEMTFWRERAGTAASLVTASRGDVTDADAPQT
jgi:sulfotransferase